MKITRNILGFFLLAVFFYGALWTMRISVADHFARQENEAGLTRAIQLIPDDAENCLKLALLISEENPNRAMQLLQLASQRNPLDSRVWIEQGLRYEVSGDLVSAEVKFLQAVKVDAGFLPRWSLANFYFRQNNIERFWSWLRTAVPMSFGDPVPMFRLAEEASPDGQLIDKAPIRSLDMRNAYLRFLLDDDKISHSYSALHYVLSAHRRDDLQNLLYACDRYLTKSDASNASMIWQQLAIDRFIPYSPQSMDKKELVTNPSFTEDPLSVCLDWRPSAADGISFSRLDSSEGIRISFTGKQPEDVNVLSQYVLVQEGTQYSLSSTYFTKDVVQGAGFSWQIFDAQDHSLLGGGKDLSSETEKQELVTFHTPEHCKLILLVLNYHRGLGTTRTEGFFHLKRVDIKQAIADHS